MRGRVGSRWLELLYVIRGSGQWAEVAEGRGWQQAGSTISSSRKLGQPESARRRSQRHVRGQQPAQARYMGRQPWDFLPGHGVDVYGCMCMYI